jgi:hypothetical protein
MALTAAIALVPPKQQHLATQPVANCRKQITPTPTHSSAGTTMGSQAHLYRMTRAMHHLVRGPTVRSQGPGTTHINRTRTHINRTHTPTISLRARGVMLAPSAQVSIYSLAAEHWCRTLRF